jgi:hypothetical protein
MNDNSTTEQNLDVIRGLIERGEIYRAVSARTALIGGVLSILTAGAIYLNDEITRIWDRPVRPRELAFAWLGVLLLTVTVSVLFLSRSARDSGGAMNSRRMKLALRTIAPYSYNRLPRRRRTGSRRRLDRLLRTNASLDRVVRSTLARASRLGVSAHQPECAGVQRYHRQSGRRCSQRSDGCYVRSLSSHLRRSQLAAKTGDAMSNWLEESARSQLWLGNCSKTMNACFPHLRDRRRSGICLSAPETERNATGHS